MISLKSTEPKTATLLKNYINITTIKCLAKVIHKHHPLFVQREFVRQSADGLQGMPLKARVQHISKVLSNLLPADYQYNAVWLKQLAVNWPDRQSDKGWQSFMAWPLIDYAGKNGLHQPEAALDLLKHLTPLFTAEFAVRPYLKQHFALTYQHMLEWTHDKDEHVRRLASEGLRPRLPWAEHLAFLKSNPEPVIELLSNLKDDTSRYVQKSVANNLNDISKDHPQRIIETGQAWLVGASSQRQWILHHGLRSLIKTGHPEVFPLLGYSDNPAVKVELALEVQHIEVGETFEINVSVCSTTTHLQRIVMDYRIWHVKANGQATAKVFKWKNITLQPEETICLNKTHGFYNLTTRRYYRGPHNIEILINGVIHAQAEINLLVE